MSLPFWNIHRNTQDRTNRHHNCYIQLREHQQWADQSQSKPKWCTEHWMPQSAVHRKINNCQTSVNCTVHLQPSTVSVYVLRIMPNHSRTRTRSSILSEQGQRIPFHQPVSFLQSVWFDNLVRSPRLGEKCLQYNYENRDDIVLDGGWKCGGPAIALFFTVTTWLQQLYDVYSGLQCSSYIYENAGRIYNAHS